MSEQRLTSGGRKREKYIPLRERQQNNVLPLYDRPEAQQYLMTVESMLEKSTGTLQDSMWAPHNIGKQNIGKSFPQRSGTAQQMASAAKTENAKPTQRATSAWNTDTPKPSAARQMQSNWENQASQPRHPSAAGLGASSWAAQPTQAANPMPEFMAPLTSRAGPQQSSKDGLTQSRNAQKPSYVPAHLRGIDIEEEPTAPPTVSQPFPLPIVRETPNPAATASAPRITTLQDTDAEAWARKMGLLPEISPQSQVPTPQQNQGTGHVQKLATKATNDAPAQSKDEKVAQNAPFNNARFHLKEDSSETFQDYIQRSTVTNGKKYTFNHSSPTIKKQNAPINTQQSGGATSGPYERREISHQQLHQHGTRASGGWDVPAAPVQSSSANAGGSWGEQKTQAPQAPQAAQASAWGAAPSASVTNAQIPQAQSSGWGAAPVAGPAQAQYRGRGVPPTQQQQPAPQSTSYIQQLGQNNIENRVPATKQDPNMISTPAQMPTSNVNAQNASVREDTAFNGPWPTMQSTDVKSFNDKVSPELYTSEHVPTNIPPLTQDALVTTTGFLPRDHSLNFEDQISDDGIFVRNSKEAIRATQGMDASNQLLDWDKKRWAPPPCDWENDRAGFDDSFMPDYIREWRADIPCGPSIQVDITADEFLNGKAPVSNDSLIDPIEQPDSIPDRNNGENEIKRLHQTALVDANNFLARMEKKQRRAEAFKNAADVRNLEIAMAVDEPNPFSPKIDMYVRPAQLKDAQDIMKIYNYYVVTSIIPEDQQPISLEDAQALIDTARREKLPFVVAVKGHLPAKHDAQGRIRSTKVILPQVELVLGFAFAERFNYAFSGSARGRSRGTVTLQLYVDPGNTRKGVGRNTLDHLLHCMATAYTFKNGCPWINPDNDPIHEPNGCGLLHQMLMMVPVLKNDDPNFPWLSKFLYNYFWFKEENRMKSVARSSVAHGTGRMLDVAVLQCELLHEGEWDAFA